MPKSGFFIIFLILIHLTFFNASGAIDSLRIGKVLVSGYTELYFGYDFNLPENQNHPYAVSTTRHNRPAVNLAYLTFSYSQPAWRVRFSPGIGTYMKMNYVAEPNALKNIFEANAGFRLSKRHNIWLDAGVIGSPFTNESPVSKDQVMFTRSLSAEYVPYYLSGARLNIPVQSNLQLNIYMLTGWQQIKDQNSSPALATQLVLEPKKNLLMNWSTFLGKESSVTDPYQGYRFFNDFYIIRTAKKWTFSSCVYLGVQEQVGGKFASWGQANLIAGYSLRKNIVLSGRLEYFRDKGGVQIKNLTNDGFFETTSTSLGLKIKLRSHLLYRAEARYFYSPQKSFIKSTLPVYTDNWLITGLTWWF